MEIIKLISLEKDYLTPLEVASVKKMILLSLLVLVFISCSSKPEKKEAPVKKESAKKETKAESVKKVEKHVLHKVHWSYEGITGPDFWASLNENYKTCKEGKSQSPIDLKWKKPISGGNLDFKYKAGNFGVVDNGHTLQVNLPKGNKVNIRGHEYELIQLHFHSSSEHTLSGNQLAMEVHFVHKDKMNNLAVLGAFMIEGAHSSLFQQIVDNVPSQQGIEKMVEGASFNPRLLLPQITTYYHYYGSLTTPPCTEGVNWNVLNTPMTLSKEQIKSFRRFYSNNYRPVQPLNGRKVTNY